MRIRWTGENTFRAAVVRIRRGVWVCRSEDSSYKKKKKVRMRKAVNKTHWNECEIGGWGRRFSTPRSICSTGSLLSDCQGQFHLFLTCAVFFFYHSNSLHTPNKPFEAVYACTSRPHRVFSFLVILTPSVQTDFPLCIYLIPSVTGDIGSFVGFGWHFP